MITLAFFNSLLILMMIMTLNFKNPVKLSIMLMLISTTIFMEMYVMSSSVWYLMLFLLIFTGGILMMFMILSSILPNEKTKKSKKMVLFLPFMFMFLSPPLQSNFSSGVTKSIKASLDSSGCITVLMMLMLSYFLTTILMVSKEEIPMRKSSCQSKN